MALSRLSAWVECSSRHFLLACLSDWTILHSILPEPVSRSSREPNLLKAEWKHGRSTSPGMFLTIRVVLSVSKSSKFSEREQHNEKKSVGTSDAGAGRLHRRVQHHGRHG